MDDLGRPIAYTALAEGTPVYDRDGERIGVVDHVLADEAVDIFRGLVVHATPLSGRHLFADADQIAEIHQRGVLLSVVADELHEPRAPSEGATGDELRSGDAPPENPLQASLRRAWDWIGGQR